MCKLGGGVEVWTLFLTGVSRFVTVTALPPFQKAEISLYVAEKGMKIHGACVRDFMRSISHECRGWNHVG